MRKKTARVTIETERLLVISRAAKSIEAWCEVCGVDARFVPVDTAAAVAAVSQRTIFRRAEADEIHLIETADGKAMFCLNSIVRRGESRRLLRP